jgi:hypothetical protein
MADDVSYEAPAVTAVNAVDTPLIGVISSPTGNPQWNDEDVVG